MVGVSSTTATQRLLVRSLATSTRILNQVAGASPSSASSPSSSSSTTPSIHERQSRQRQPQSILHVADAGGATMAATLRAIELTKARKESATPSSTTTQPARGARQPPAFIGEGGLGSLLSRRRRAQGVVYDQDAQEIGALASSAPSPTARQSNTGASARSPRATLPSPSSSERRPERLQSSSGDPSFAAAFTPRERRESRTPSSSSSSGPRPPRSGPPSQARGGPQRPPTARRPHASPRSSPPRGRKPFNKQEESRPLPPLVVPKYVQVPALDLSALPSSTPAPTKTTKPSAAKKAYDAYLGVKTPDGATTLGERQRGVLLHANRLLSRNPSVGLKGRQVVLKKVEEALMR
ncbi:BZ3500_MvSof-1268-A1-R1_Chr6-3g08673 [Microbotryum saponariae]|uniref:BZ3500_MvSof-1268-A1-R1_Chr6-3g08673 protein n=1 Tax=Microbotryum saponariae TaxID=289078 RepID=A0A2X0LJP0_9BASI|nr:BZ3500_MvSof-1268-A1-R1_Chr6-3g08673 [Microbotryum saponariae]SDA07274.1 BZ3501_MvSof-1269-A2-R1_Chr6-2g08376 [Microbotryum saponariae]